MLGEYATALRWLERAKLVFHATWVKLPTDRERIVYGDHELPTTFNTMLQMAHWNLVQREDALVASEYGRSRAFQLLLSKQRLSIQSPLPAIAPPALDAAQQLRIDDIRGAVPGSAVLVFTVLNVGTTNSHAFAWLVRSSDGQVLSKMLHLSAHLDQNQHGMRSE